MPEDDQFRRGREAGEIAARLAQHDMHFADINGSIAKLADEVQKLAISVQRMAASAQGQEGAAQAVADALARAEQERRADAEHKWSSFQKLFAFIGALTAIIIAAGVIATFVHH